MGTDYKGERRWKIELTKFLSNDYNRLLKAGGLTLEETYEFTKHVSKELQFMERTDGLFMEDMHHGCLEVVINIDLPEIRRRCRMKWNKKRCEDQTFTYEGTVINYRFVYKEGS